MSYAMTPEARQFSYHNNIEYPPHAQSAQPHVLETPMSIAERLPHSPAFHEANSRNGILLPPGTYSVYRWHTDFHGTQEIFALRESSSLSFAITERIESIALNALNKRVFEASDLFSVKAVHKELLSSDLVDVNESMIELVLNRKNLSEDIVRIEAEKNMLEYCRDFITTAYNSGMDCNYTMIDILRKKGIYIRLSSKDLVKDFIQQIAEASRTHLHIQSKQESQLTQPGWRITAGLASTQPINIEEPQVHGQSQDHAKGMTRALQLLDNPKADGIFTPPSPSPFLLERGFEFSDSSSEASSNNELAVRFRPRRFSAETDLSNTRYHQTVDAPARIQNRSISNAK